MGNEETNLQEIHDINTKITFIDQEIVRLEHEKSTTTKDKDEKTFTALEKNISALLKRKQELSDDRSSMIEEL